MKRFIQIQKEVCGLLEYLKEQSCIMLVSAGCDQTELLYSSTWK